MKNLNTYLESASTQGWREVDIYGMESAINGRTIGEFTKGESAAVVRAVHSATQAPNSEKSDPTYWGAEITERRHSVRNLDLRLFNLNTLMIAHAVILSNLPPDVTIANLYKGRDRDGSPSGLYKIYYYANNIYIRIPAHGYEINILKCDDDWYYVSRTPEGIYTSDSGFYICDQLTGLVGLINHFTVHNKKMG
jgi:hypothetical protein